MNARLLLTALLGVAIGATAVSLNPLRSAPAPEPKPQRWEYKVVHFDGVQRADETADKLSEQLNTFAKDGWEYAGPIVSETTAGRARVVPGVYVAFRRFKP
jgi:hypothetical protein